MSRHRHEPRRNPAPPWTWLLLVSLAPGCAERPSPPTSDAPSLVAGLPAEALVPPFIRHAKRFTAHPDRGSLLVEVNGAWQGSTAGFRYRLVPRADFERWRADGGALGGSEDTTLVPVPSRRVVALSTTYLPALEMLGAIDRLIGVSRAGDVSNPTVRARLAAGELFEAGPVTSVDREKILEAGPDLIWTFAVGDGDLAAYEPLRRAGLPIVVTGDYMEDSPLGRAEWIKFFALFLGKETVAESVFAGIETRYAELCRLAQSATTRPTVMLESSFQGTWYVPGGRSYVARFLKDANARYLWSDDPTEGSLRLGLEAVLERAHDADYWLNTGGWRSLADAVAEDPRHARFRPVPLGTVYNHDARLSPDGGNDFFETGPARPDLVLADLIQILHPELALEHSLVWYRRLPGGAGGARGAEGTRGAASAPTGEAP